MLEKKSKLDECCSELKRTLCTRRETLTRGLIRRNYWQIRQNFRFAKKNSRILPLERRIIIFVEKLLKHYLKRPCLYS